MATRNEEVPDPCDVKTNKGEERRIMAVKEGIMGGDNLVQHTQMLHADAKSYPHGTQVIINNAVPVSPYAPPPPIVYRKRWIFILLGLIFGCFGIHNFYAGFAGRGTSQLLLSLILIATPLTCLPVFIWVLFEILFVTEDARAVRLI